MQKGPEVLPSLQPLQEHEEKKLVVMNSPQNLPDFSAVYANYTKLSYELPVY